MISRTRGGGGGLWRSLECPSAAGPPPRQRPVQSRPWCLRLAPHSGLHIVQQRPGPGSRQGPSGWADRAGASLTGAASFLRRPPPAWPQPLSGCGLEGRPRGPEPLGAPSTPLSRHRCQCALGGRMRDNSTYTGVHAYLFLLFRKKKKSFSCFSSFCCFFFEFFFFFKL